MSNPQNISEKQHLAKRTRIAFCITELDAGGAEKALVKIAGGLSQGGWDCIVYCLGPEAELVAELREQGVRVECYGGTKWHVWGAVRWLTRQLEEFRPELLQCFLFHGNIVGRLAGQKAKVPVILAGHRVAERQKRWHLWLERLTKRKVTHHVAVSREVGAFIKQQMHLNTDECSVIPNGVDIDPQSVPGLDDGQLAELKIKPDRALIVAVGRLHPQKGYEDLLAAMARLRDQGQTPHLIIVGDGPQKSALKSVTTYLNMNESVTFAGYRKDALSIMKRADLFVLSSHWEGMSNALLEAMALGLPIVATDVEGVRELVSDGESGLIVAPRDAEQLAGAMHRLLTDRNLSGQLAAQAQSVVVERFTWRFAVELYKSLFNQLLKNDE